MLKFLQHICQLIMSPGNGWEDISYAGDDPKQLAKVGLYPLFGVAAITVFAQYFYKDLSLITVLQYAIVTFVQFFVSYFFAMVVFASIMGQCVEGEVNEKKYTTVITYSLAIVSIIAIVKNLLPLDLSIIDFIYVYVGIVLWKSARYLVVKDDKLVQFLVVAIISILGVPYAFGAILKFIIG